MFKNNQQKEGLASTSSANSDDMKKIRQKEFVKKLREEVKNPKSYEEANKEFKKFGLKVPDEVSGWAMKENQTKHKK